MNIYDKIFKNYKSFENLINIYKILNKFDEQLNKILIDAILFLENYRKNI